MDKFFGKLVEFSFKYIFLGLVGVAIVFGGLFYYFIYTDKKLEIDRLENELKQLQLELQKAEAYAARYDEFKEELRLVDLRLKEALKKLPEEKDIPNLLDQINASVIDAGLQISLFRPTGQIQKDFYSEVPVQIQVAGGYHNWATFADVISKMERIVTLRNIALTPRGNQGDLNISCLAVTFRQSAQ